MKRTLYIMAAIVLPMTLALSSCTKELLEETVYSSLTDELAFSTGENAQSAVNSLYVPLHTIYRGVINFYNDRSTDVGCNQSRSTIEETLNDEALYHSGDLKSTYEQFCLIYTRANVVIDQIPAMDPELFGDVDNTPEEMVAEAKFMRAFAYYNLTDLFYQVPLVTSSTVTATDRPDYAKIEDIEAVIEQDLKDAAAVLPKSWNRAQAQRPTYGAAKAYLTRLYMRQAGRTRLAGKDASSLWQKALTEVNSVLALVGSEYELLEDCFAPFDPSTDDALYNKELIWAARASRFDSQGSWDLGLMFTPWNFDCGWCINSDPLEVMWMYEPEDTRLKKLIVADYPDVYVVWGSTDYHITAKSAQEVGTMTKKLPADYASFRGIEESYVSTYKFKFLYTLQYYYNTPNNFPLVRVSDMYLCKTEILNELNGPSEATLEGLNKVRERAFGNTDHNFKASDYASKDALRSAICDERARELESEAVRRPDLIRMGLWKDRLEKYFASCKEKAQWKARNNQKADDFYKEEYAIYPTDLTENDIRRYYPIPFREVELNENLKNARDF